MRVPLQLYVDIELAQELRALVPDRQRSEFVREAVRKALKELKLKKSKNRQDQPIKER